MGGLRLMVQHAVSNRVICQLQASVHPDPVRFSATRWLLWNTALSKQYALQAYIDAQSGGEGRGFTHCDDAGR